MLINSIDQNNIDKVCDVPKYIQRLFCQMSKAVKVNKSSEVSKDAKIIN